MDPKVLGELSSGLVGKSVWVVACPLASGGGESVAGGTGTKAYLVLRTQAQLGWIAPEVTFLGLA